MKRFLFVLSLSVSLIVFSLGIFTGIRVLPSLWRSFVAFCITYAGGLVAVLILFTTVFSREQHEHNLNNNVSQSHKAV